MTNPAKPRTGDPEADAVPTLGGLENPPPAPTGRDKVKDPREENIGQGRSLGDRRMHERAVGGEGGGQPYDRPGTAENTSGNTPGNTPAKPV